MTKKEISGCRASRPPLGRGRPFGGVSGGHVEAPFCFKWGAWSARGPSFSLAERGATLSCTVEVIGSLAEAQMMRGIVLLWLDAPDEGVAALGGTAAAS